MAPVCPRAGLRDAATVQGEGLSAVIITAFTP
jgi:hypothetical protein